MASAFMTKNSRFISHNYVILYLGKMHEVLIPAAFMHFFILSELFKKDNGYESRQNY